MLLGSYEFGGVAVGEVAVAEEGGVVAAMGREFPEVTGKGAIGFVFVGWAWRGGTAGAVAKCGDVFGMRPAGWRWMGVGAAVGPVFGGAADGVGVDDGRKIFNRRQRRERRGGGRGW